MLPPVRAPAREPVPPLVPPPVPPLLPPKSPGGKGPHKPLTLQVPSTEERSRISLSGALGNLGHLGALSGSLLHDSAAARRLSDGGETSAGGSSHHSSDGGSSSKSTPKGTPTLADTKAAVLPQIMERKATYQERKARYAARLQRWQSAMDALSRDVAS